LDVRAVGLQASDSPPTVLLVPHCLIGSISLSPPLTPCLVPKPCWVGIEQNLLPSEEERRHWKKHHVTDNVRWGQIWYRMYPEQQTENGWATSDSPCWQEPLEVGTSGQKARSQLQAVKLLLRSLGKASLSTCPMLDSASSTQFPGLRSPLSWLCLGLSPGFLSALSS
jgi:hypothetical protein